MTKDKPRILSKEQVLNYKDFLTVGKLKKFIQENNIPDDAMVLSQRVEDVYFEKNHWGVYPKRGEHWYYAITYDGMVANREIKGERLSEDEIFQSLEQYHPVLSPCLYEDDQKDFLFLDLHY